jgi:hypothetical protein
MDNNRRVDELSVTSKVRKYSLFKKSIAKASMTPAWSDEVYTVVKVEGSTIWLNDGAKHKRYNLLHVPDDTESSHEKNVIIKSMQHIKK